MRTARVLGHSQVWRTTKLGDVAEFIMGQAPPGSASNFEGQGTVFVKAGEFGASHPIIREWTTKPLRFARSGDVLICVVGATAGKLNQAIDCAIGRSVAAIRPSEDIIDRFLYLQLLPKVRELRAASMGSAQGVINKQMLGNIDVVIPSIDEQRQIVAEIEKQFTRLEAGVAGLRRVQANLKRYRAAVLKAACEGKLVPTEAELAKERAKEKVAAASRRWSSAQEQSRDGSATQEGPDYETGAQLLERILIERREKWTGKGKYKEPVKPDTAAQPALPEGWVWASVEQLSTRVQYGTSAKTNEDSTGVPVLRMGNIQDGKFDFDKLKYLPMAHAEFPELLLTRGDLLFNRTNSAELVGKTAVFNGTPHPCSFASYLIRVRLCTGCLPDLVSYFINSVFGRAWIADVVSQQVGQANVNGTKLQALTIPLPPLAEQARIVAEVERRLSVVEELETVLTANLQRATGLRQSILQRAFKGRLLNHSLGQEVLQPVEHSIAAESKDTYGCLK